MGIYNKNITETKTASLLTELHFAISEARAFDSELISLTFENLLDKPELSALQKALKEEKKTGKILLFALFDSLSGDNMEARYLINKFPDVVIKASNTAKQGFLIKL